MTQPTEGARRDDGPMSPTSHWSRSPAATGRDGHGLGVLDEETCLRLLGEQHVGRLGFSAGSLPVIHPVNYVLSGRSILFGSEAGEKLRAAEQHAVACLQIDHHDAFEHSGWSVLATGRLRVLPAGEVPVAPGAHGPAPWALRADHLVELSAEILSGRVIGGLQRGRDA